MAWVNGYTYRQKITVAAQSHIAANQTDFSVSINIPSSNTDFWTNEDGTGTYVRFALLDGTLLKFQVESYDAVGDDAWFHVKIPTLSATVGTDIYVYYKATTPTAGDDKENTWETNFAGVYHLNQDQAEGAFDDATANNNDGTNYSTTDFAGQIDRGRDLSGTNQYIDCGNDASLSVTYADSFTIEAWVDPDSTTSNDIIAAKGNAFTGPGWHLRVTTGGKYRFILIHDGSNWKSVDTNAIGAGFEHVVGVWDGSTIKIYRNGVDESADTSSGTVSNITTTASLLLGTDSGGTLDMDGRLDEITFSKGVARSADWVKARYQSGLGTWLTFAAQETYTPGIINVSGTAANTSTATGTLFGGTIPALAHKTEWNPADKDANITLSGNDLVATSTLTNWRSVRAVDGKAANKWYWEVTLTVAAGNIIVGVGNSSASLSTYAGANTNSWGYSANGATYYNAVANSAGIVTATQGDVINIALDMDNGKLWFGKNGTWMNSGDPATGANPIYTGVTGTIFPMGSPLTLNDALTANFGNTALAYTVPTGFISGPDEWTSRGVVIGDSIANGDQGAGNSPGKRLEVLRSYNTGDVLNKGINGQNTLEVDTRFQADALDVKAGEVYIICGTNNLSLAPGYDLSTTISHYTSMITKAKAMTPVPDVILSEILPKISSGGPFGYTQEQLQEAIKLYNAAIRKLCVEQEIWMAPAYQEMAETDVNFEDDLESVYSADGTHPNSTGYDRLGDLCDVGAKPTRLYRWGIAVAAVDDEGWAWWILNGTSSVAGDANIGTLTLPQNQNADSDVKCIEELNKIITISPTITAGTVTIKYRTSANNFDRDDAVIGWTAYSAPFATSDQFIQIRLEGSSVADATITDNSLTWTAGQQTIWLGGTIAGISTLSGSLNRIIELGGSIAGTSTLSGSLNRAIGLGGAVTATSGLSAALNLNIGLAGTIAGISTLSGSLTVGSAGILLTGTVAGASGLSAALNRNIGLGGTISATSALTGTLTVDVSSVTLQDIYDLLKKSLTLSQFIALK